jgi:hypothetical protein
MALQNMQAFTSCAFPDAQSSVIASTGQVRVNRAESDRADFVSMSMKCAQMLASVNVPQMNILVIVAASKQTALSVKSYSPDQALMLQHPKAIV